MIKEIWEQLQKRAEYAVASRNLELMYETYGMVKMAREMCAITKEQFAALNEKLVRKGINDPRAYDTK